MVSKITTIETIGIVPISVTILFPVLKCNTPNTATHSLENSIIYKHLSYYKYTKINLLIQHLVVWSLYRAERHEHDDHSPQHNVGRLHNLRRR